MLLGWLVLITFLTNCRITYIVRLNGTDLYGKLQMPCGYGKVFLKGKGKRYFTFWQVFYLKGKARYHPDSIHAWVNDRPLTLETVNLTHKKRSGHGEFSVYNGDTVTTRFFIPEGVFEEDIIVIKTSGLMECRGMAARGEEFQYYFNRNEFIRIH